MTYVATAAAIMGRLEKLGVEPGDEIPAEVFDESYGGRRQSPRPRRTSSFWTSSTR